MTTPNVAQTNSTATSSEVVPEVSPIETNVTESKSEAESNNVESFDSWLKNREAKKAGSDTKSKEEPKKDQKLPKDDSIDQKNIKTDENKAEKVAKSEDSGTNKSQEPAEPAITLNNKTYKAQDIEQLTKSHSEMEAKHNENIQRMNSFAEQLKSDPASILDKLQLDEKTWDLVAKKYYEKFIEPQTLTAEQKLERYQKADQERQEAEAKAKAEAEENARVERNRRYWEEKISESLDGEGLPKTQWTINRLAGYIDQANKQGVKATPQELAKLVREDMIESQKSTLKDLTPEQIAAALGEEGVKKFREHQTEKYKQQKFENKNTQVVSKVEKPKKDGKKYSSPYDLLDDI